MKIINYGIKQGYKAVSVDFQEADEDEFTNSERLLKWFCDEITWQLEIEDKIAQDFQELTYSNSQCSDYFQQYLLSPKIPTPLVLVLYKVELILEHPGIANNFFGLLRFWHQNLNNEDIWRKLRLVIVHSKDTFLRVDPPFSVGIRIEFS
jgi:AAA-like domain